MHQYQMNEVDMHFVRRRLMALACMLASSLMLNGCQSTRSQDNRTWTHLVCSGSSSDWTQCWKEARRICPSGRFDMANKQEQRESLKREVDIACK